MAQAQAADVAVSSSDERNRLFPPFSTSSASFHLVAQGAESLLYRTTYLSSSQPAALKVRPKKGWRHPILDKRLTRARILAEARVLVKLSGEGIAVETKKTKQKVKDSKPGEKGVGSMRQHVPAVLGLDWEAGWLVTEWIEGRTVKQAIYDTAAARNTSEDKEGAVERLKRLLRRIGEVIGKLHAAGVIHGDLTTSNLMLRPPPPTDAEASTGDSSSPASLAGDIVLIDFGLSSQSSSDEDRAVDLYVLERAFGSTHPREEDLFTKVLEAYAEGEGSGMAKSAGSKAKGLTEGGVVLRKLEDVRMRGRKKSMIG